MCRLKSYSCSSFWLFVILITTVIAAETTPSPDTDYAEKLRKQAEIVFQEQLKKLYDVANGTNSPDKRNIKGFVLSTEVRSFRDIPANVDQEIQALRESIRALIFKVATDIELHGSSGTVSIASGGMIEYQELPGDAVEEIKRMMEAKEKNNVSVRSIQLAIQMLANLNNQLMDNAQKEENIDKKRKLYIMQSAFVYEMSDIVYDFLDKISLEGKIELEKISAEHQERIRNRMADVDKLITKAKQAKEQGIIKPETADAQEKSYHLLKEANNQTLQAWKEVMQKVSQQDNALQNIKSKRVAIELIRDSAKTQLDTLRDIRVVGEFHSLIGNMDSLMTVVEGLQLLELKPDVVKTLLFGNPIREGADLK